MSSNFANAIIRNKLSWTGQKLKRKLFNDKPDKAKFIQPTLSMSVLLKNLIQSNPPEGIRLNSIELFTDSTASSGQHTCHMDHSSMKRSVSFYLLHTI